MGQLGVATVMVIPPATGAWIASGATGITSASQTLTFLSGENFKNLSIQVNSQGPTVAGAAITAYEGYATLAAASVTGMPYSSVLYSDAKLRNANQPFSNWARQQAGQFAPGPPITVTVTNADKTNYLVIMASITAENGLFF